MEDQFLKLKQEVKGVILSCPRGLTINQFLKDYKHSIGRSFPFQELGYESIPDLLRDMSDIVRLNPGYHGNSSVLVPVVDEKVAHINSMISNQKLTSNKFSMRPVPRRSVLDDAKVNRKPVQLPLENRANLTCDERNVDNSNVYNGYPEKNKPENYSNEYGEDEPQQNQNAPANYSSTNGNTNEYQSNQFSDGFCYNSEGYSHNSGINDYYEEEDLRSDCISDYIDQSDSVIQNGLYENPLGDDFERPPTPGEIIVNEKMKKNFQLILQEHPEGIPSAKFCKLYHEKFGRPLRYLDYGVKDFQELIVKLPDVFHFVPQRHSQQWILYDSQQAVPSGEVPRWIPNYIVMNIAELAQNFPDGLKKTDLIFLYRERFRVDLDVQTIGFPSIDSFLQSCSSIDFVSVNGEEMIYPKPPTTTDEQLDPLPPVSDMLYLWRGEFSENECDPSMHYQPFKLIQIDKLNFAKVFVCDVISPNSLWLQMADQRDELSKLMLNLNDYYNKYERKHIMSNYGFTVNGLICAVKFHIDGRWHRAKILSHNTSTNRVTVCYVDYGTESEVSITEIRKLEKSFYDLPVQAVDSALYGLIPKLDNFSPPTYPIKWPLECVDYLYSMCFEKTFNIDVLEIDKSIPKLKVVLSDGCGSTINDKVLDAGFALSIVDKNIYAQEKQPELTEQLQGFPDMHQEPLTINPESNFQKRIQSPPGYSKSQQISTCARIIMLREESISLQLKLNEIDKTREELEATKKKYLEEANVLENMICKHPHPLPEGFESVVNDLGQLNLSEMNQEPSINDISIDPKTKLKDDQDENAKENAIKPVIKPLYQDVVGQPLTRQSQSGFPSQQMPMDPSYGQVPESHNVHQPPLPMPMDPCYGQVPESHSVHQPQLPQMVHPHHLPQHHNFVNYSPQFFPTNAMLNPMARSPMDIGNKSFMGPRPTHMGPYPSYSQPQNMMYPQNPHGLWGHQWNSPHPGVMSNSYRPAMFPNKSVPVRTAFNRPTQPRVTPTSLQNPAGNEVVPSTDAPPSTPDFVPAKTYPSEELPVDVITPSAPSLDEIDVGMPTVDSAEEVVAPEDVAVDAASATVPSSFSFSGAKKVLDVVTPPLSPPPSYDYSHLSEKKMKKLQKSDDLSVVPPSTNNWKDIFSPSNLSPLPKNINPSKSDDPHYPIQALMEVMKEETQTKEEILEDECNKLEVAITNCLGYGGEPINHAMKICVKNIHGSSYMHLILVGDAVAVLLKQLFYNYWWGEPDDESYKNIMTNLKDEQSLAYSIFYTEYISIFERLKEENFIDADDLYVHLVNLKDVPAALDIICPSDKHDLSEIKRIFNELYETVLPVDAFWFGTKQKAISQID